LDLFHWARFQVVGFAVDLAAGMNNAVWLAEGINAFTVHLHN